MQSTQEPEVTSTRPYLIRALHEWCCDNGLTPFVTVSVDNSVQVPREYVKDDEIVLNIGFDATTSLNMGNDYLEFKARFSGAVRDIMVPIDNIIAIFARENGQGMAFPKVDRPKITPLKKDNAAPAVKSAPAMATVDGPGAQGGGKADVESPQSVVTKPTKAPTQVNKPTLTRIK